MKPSVVIPAKAGNQLDGGLAFVSDGKKGRNSKVKMDSSFRWNDDSWGCAT